MFGVLRIAFTGIIFLLSFGEIFATDFPFTDVKTTDSDYSAVKNLFDAGIISDDGSHLFHPEKPINRDAFVGLSMSVSCEKCLTPSIDDIIKYQTSPFIDLTKQDPYYYCISSAGTKNIIQGYMPDATGKASCQDGSSFSTAAFCPNNQTSRIESAAMLLRQANLWNDTMNTGFQKTINISDVSSYWQGYAEKGIAAGILTLGAGNKINSDAPITRAEYALMAQKILTYNQCAPDNNINSIPSQIVTKDKNGNILNTSVFSQNSTDILEVVSISGNWSEQWAVTNPTTKEIKTGTGNTFPLSNLTCGDWLNNVNILNEDGTRVSTSSNTIHISCPNEKDGGMPLSIIADPTSTGIGNPVSFSLGDSGSDQKSKYTWNFGDGIQSSVSGNTKHTYTEAGTYAVTLTVVNTSGNTVQSNIVVSISGERDSDHDGIQDNQDICPMVKGDENNKGCPIVSIQNYSNQIEEKLSGKESTTTLDIPLISGLTENLCLAGKAKTDGLIIASPVCTTCPCDNSVEVRALVRSCDIIFPTILSKDQKDIFSRGGLFLVP